ncbi:hypothetical protein D3C85_1021720 [compost metagenome]
MQLVRDDDEALALIGQAPHNDEQLLGFQRCEHPSRLVQNNDVSPLIQHLQDLNALLQTERNVGYLLAWIDRQAIFSAQLIDL